MNRLHRFNLSEGTKSSHFLPNKDTNFYTIPNETDIFMVSISSEKTMKTEKKKNVVMSKMMGKMTTMTNISILHALKIKEMLPTKNHTSGVLAKVFYRNVMYHFA